MKKQLLILGLFIPFFLVGCSTDEDGSSVHGEQTTSNSSIVSSDSSSTSESSSSRSSSSEGPVHVKSISLDQSKIGFYQDDPSITLIATVLPETAENKNITWSSSNTSVATVSEGIVTPVNPGEATITAKTVDGNKTATCKVSVYFPDYVIHGKYNGKSSWEDIPMIYNELSSSEYMLLGVQLYKNDIFKIHMYGDVWYGIDDLKNSVAPGLVTDSGSDGNIKVLATGVYDIYSSYNEFDDGHIYIKSSDYTPSPGTVHVEDIMINRSGKYLQHRYEYQLTATIYPSTASDKTVTWTSSDESVATVTTSGRVIAKEKTGTTVITATTNDGHKTDTCLIYVSAYERPEYFLTGTIGGRTYSANSYTYAALPLGSHKYLIPNVDLVKGDELKVMLRNGSYLHSTSKIGNPVYTYSVNENKSVNMYLDTTKTDNYLSAVNRASRDIFVKYDSDTNNNDQCGWIFVQGTDITPVWMKSTSLLSGSTGCAFNIPKHATNITFVRAPRDQTPDNYYESLNDKSRVKMFNISSDTYEYDARVDS